jgi:hypothetical protein
MSNYYASEEERMSEFRDIMGHYGLAMDAGTIHGTDYRTDGHLRVDEHLVLLVEGKNEIGSKGAEPIFQGLAHYSFMVGKLQKTRPKDRFPMLLIQYRW